MSKYLYILSAETPFSETELKGIKDDISRLFKCTEVAVSNGKVFTLQSPLAPEDVESLAEAVKKFRLQVKAGGRVD